MNFRDTNTMKPEDAAAVYTAAGWHITPLKPGTKAAYLPTWNKTGSRPASYWHDHPEDGIGLLLGDSNILVVDIDDPPAFMQAMKSIGFDRFQNPFFRSSTAGTDSGKRTPEGKKASGKLYFSIPAEIDPAALKYHKLVWTRSVIFELRTGAVQDVLPPSRHPDIGNRKIHTGNPYQWIGGEIEPAPPDLIEIWTNWETYEPYMRRSDPEYEPPQFFTRINTLRRVRTPRPGEIAAAEIIQQWIRDRSISADLKKYGYKPAVGNRFISPKTHTGRPGIAAYEFEGQFFSYGESDPFSDGHRHNSFDLLVHYEFGGSISGAMKFIKSELGIIDPPRSSGKKKPTATTGNRSDTTAGAPTPEACSRPAAAEFTREKTPGKIPDENTREDPETEPRKEPAKE